MSIHAARIIAYQRKVNCVFCSQEVSCAGIKRHEKFCYLNPLNKKLCPVCQNPIKNYRTNTCCSYACSNSHFRTGPNHGNWKEEAYVSTCFHYHKKECVVCKESNIVEAHHFDGNRNNNDPSNLIPLCPTHHKYWHSRFRHLIENAITEYHTKWSEHCQGGETRTHENS